MAGILGRLFGEEPRKRKPKESKPNEKLTLVRFLDDYAYKEDIQAVLSSLDMSTSGNKDDLLRRLMKTEESKSPKGILNFLNNDSLKDACSDYGLPVGGNKDDLVHRVIANILAKPSVVEPGTVQRPTKPVTNAVKDSQALLREILEKHLGKSDIRRGLGQLDLKISGSSEELIERLLKATNSSPRETLNLMDGQHLQEFADKSKIPRRRGKEDQVEEILVAFFGYPRNPKEAAPEPRIEERREIEREVESPTARTGQIPPAPRPSYARLDASFETLVEDIRQWIPTISFRTEEGFCENLRAHLNAKGYMTRMEKGETRPDILVNGRFPIEVKKSPRREEFNRAFGQINQHLDAYHSVIVVICAPRRYDELEDFEESVLRTLSPKGWPIRIIGIV